MLPLATLVTNQVPGNTATGAPQGTTLQSSAVAGSTPVASGQVVAGGLPAPTTFSNVLQHAINAGALSPEIAQLLLSQAASNKNGNTPGSTSDAINLLQASGQISSEVASALQIVAPGTSVLPENAEGDDLTALQSLLAGISGGQSETGDQTSQQNTSTLPGLLQSQTTGTSETTQQVGLVPTEPLADESAKLTLARIPLASSTPVVDPQAVQAQAISQNGPVVATQQQAQTLTDNTASLVAPAVNQNNGQHQSNTLQDNKLLAIAQKSSPETIELLQQNTNNLSLQTQTNTGGNNAALNQQLLATGNESAFSHIVQNAGSTTLQGVEAGQAYNAQSIEQINTEGVKLASTQQTHQQSHTSPSEQVGLRIATAIQQGLSKINIQLEPAHLGKVEVQIDMPIDGKAQVTVLAEKTETLDQLRADAKSLERALEEAGLATDSGGLSFAMKDQHELNKENAEGGSGSNGGVAGNDNEEVEPVYVSHNVIDITV